MTARRGTRVLAIAALPLVLGLAEGCRRAEPVKGRVPLGPVTVAPPEGWAIHTISGLDDPVLGGPPTGGIRPNLVLDRTYPSIAPDEVLPRFRGELDRGEERRWEDPVPWLAPAGLSGIRIDSFRENSSGLLLWHRHVLIEVSGGTAILTSTTAASASERLSATIEALFASVE